jgi:hypothetical protein
MSDKSDKIFEALGKLDNIYRAEYREAASLLDDLLKSNEALQAQAEEYIDILSPRTWTLEQSKLWHTNIPDTFAAFAALRESVTPKQSIDSLKAAVEQETIYGVVNHVREFDCTQHWHDFEDVLHAIRNIPRRYPSEGDE